MKPYNRRELFRNFGSAAVLLHPILSIRDLHAEDAVKQRFVCMLTCAGVIQANFWPTGDAKTYSVDGRSLAPLKNHLPDLTIVKGLQNFRGDYDAHSGGGVSLLTGDLLSGIGCNKKSCDYPSGTQWAKSASIDQMISERYDSRALVLAVRPTATRPSRFISYDSKGNYVNQEVDPYAVYTSFFKDKAAYCAGSSLDAETIARTKAKRKSILDVIYQDIKDASRLGGLNAEEKAKLDAYLTSLKQIEGNIDSVAASDPTLGCDKLKPFTSGAKIPITNENYEKVGRLMMDLIIAAFQLDISRTATLVWSVGGTDGVPSTFETFGPDKEPIIDSYHALTHGERDAVNWREKCTILDAWNAKQFAYLLDGLKKAKDVNNANLLTNSLALWTSELGQGDSHTDENIPFILGGSAGGAIKTGRYMPLAKTQHHGALISILNATGLKDKKDIGSAKNVNPIL